MTSLSSSPEQVIDGAPSELCITPDCGNPKRINGRKVRRLQSHCAECHAKIMREFRARKLAREHARTVLLRSYQRKEFASQSS